VPASDPEPAGNQRSWTIYAAIASIMALILVGGLMMLSNNLGSVTITPTNDGTAAAQHDTQTAVSEAMLTPAPTDEPTITPTVTETALPTDTPTATETPDIIAAAQLVIQQQTA